MAKKRCFGCMKQKSQSPICEHCGYDEQTGNASHQLPVGTQLRGQYTVGRVLGQGGFGITYLGWDEFLDTPVAIKEYYPNGMVMREATHSLTVNKTTGIEDDRFESNLSRFLREAKALARLRNVPEVVHVHSFFRENGTAYIVMEYVEGMTLKNHVKQRGGKLSPQETFAILRPVMEALERVHAVDLVHRDISPDNIMLLPSGGVKLLDFGAVREVADADAEREAANSTEAILKHGFAPMEQYQRRGSLGPWTDVYALCATIYYCLTGTVPPDAPARMMDDIHPDWQAIPELTDRERTVLETGMQLRAKDRFPSVSALNEALFLPPPEQEPIKLKPVEPEPIKPKPVKPKSRLPVLLIFLFAIVTAIPAILFSQGSGGTVSNGSVEDSAFGTKASKNQVLTITFLDTLRDAPFLTSKAFEGNDQVFAWAVENGSLYDLYIAADGGVMAPEDCRGLFMGFTQLQSIEFGGAFYTDQVTSMRLMFAECPSLLRLDLSSFNTSQVTDMFGMFTGCSLLRELNLESLDTSQVQNMSSMFSNCDSLISLDLGHLNTSAVTDMSMLVANCDSLTSLNVSGLDTSRVEDMTMMFYYCPALTQLDLSGFDTTNVTAMDRMFCHCDGLTALDLGSFNTSRVTDMEAMFQYCTSLTQLNVSSFDTSGVTTMKNMFRRTGFTELDLSGFHTPSVTDMAGMFAECEKLSNVILSNFDTSGVETMDNMFLDTPMLTGVRGNFQVENVGAYRDFMDEGDLFNGQPWKKLFQ